jgi:hypothetical protein
MQPSRGPAIETMEATFATKRPQRNRAQEVAFNRPSSLGPPKSLAVTLRTMAHGFSCLHAVARPGREIPKVGCKGYAADEKGRQQHSDNDGKHQ